MFAILFGYFTFIREEAIIYNREALISHDPQKHRNCSGGSYYVDINLRDGRLLISIRYLGCLQQYQNPYDGPVFGLDEEMRVGACAKAKLLGRK
jgi:hypothetical protein